jgi:hypothetical protein
LQDKDLTNKNDALLKIVLSKGAKGYTDFKERLRKTWQTELLELIVCTENGQDTHEMEGRLAELWYIKHKRGKSMCSAHSSTFVTAICRLLVVHHSS